MRLPTRKVNSHFARQVFYLSLPMIVSMLSDTAMGLVDLMFISGLGTAALGATGVANAVYWFLFLVVFGLLRGVKVHTALFIGKGQALDAKSLCQVGMLTGFVLGLGIWGLSPWFGWVLEIFGIDTKMIPLAVEFLKARTLGAPLGYSLLALSAYAEGVGNTKTIMKVRVFGNILNVPLVYWLVGGGLGVPALGVTGAGLGNSIAESVQFFLLLYLVSVLWKKQWPAHSLRSKGLKLQSWVLDMSRKVRVYLPQISQVGLPTSLSFGFDMLAYTVFAVLVGKMGEFDISAHQIAYSLHRIPYTVGIAIGEAAAILIGQSLGRHHYKRAYFLARTAVPIACVTMALFAFVFAVFREPVAHFFTDESQVIEKIQILLIIAIGFQFDGFNLVLRAALRSAKDVRVPTMISIATIWISLPSAAYFLGIKMHWGVAGAWCGFLIKTFLSFILLGWRWEKGDWKRGLGTSL